MELIGILVIIALLIVGIIIVVDFYEKKRTTALIAVAQKLSMTFETKDEDKALRNHLKGFRLTSLGSGRKAYNIFTGNADDLQVKLFDYRYTVGSGKSSSTYNQTIAYFQSDQLLLPKFKMRPENVFHRIGNTFGMQDINFKEYPLFSKQYLLQGEHEEAIRELFTRQKLELFTEHKGLCVEGDMHQLLIYRNGKRVSPEEIPSFLQENLMIANTFLHS
ncbi:MAG: hypothetical protein ACPGJS_04295 [Flammeovirgaceae bacterium]